MKPGDLAIKPKFSLGDAVLRVTLIVFAVYALIAHIGVTAERDKWRSAALNAQRQLRAEGESCPAPNLADVCPAWWFGSKDLAATRKRICK